MIKSAGLPGYVRAITAISGGTVYAVLNLLISPQIKLMFSDSAGKTLDLSATQILARRAEKLATRRIWLPKLMYDALPWFYLAAGCTAFMATIYISEWFWVLPHYLLFAAGCLHLSYAVYRRRRRAARERAGSQEPQRAESGEHPATPA